MDGFVIKLQDTTAAAVAAVVRVGDHRGAEMSVGDNWVGGRVVVLAVLFNVSNQSAGNFQLGPELIRARGWIEHLLNHNVAVLRHIARLSALMRDVRRETHGCDHREWA